MKKMDRILKEWLIALCIALGIFGILYVVFWPMQVEGRSMENTLEDGQLVVVSRISGMITPYERGDLVVIHYEEAGERHQIVKRIIGVEGDHVVIKDGQVYINSVLQEESYVKGETLGNVDLYVPKGGYYVLGDHRTVSKDSRNLGCMEQKQIRGRVIFR